MIVSSQANLEVLKFKDIIELFASVVRVGDKQAGHERKLYKFL